jgi:hypothetical protein
VTRVEAVQEFAGIGHGEGRAWRAES